MDRNDLRQRALEAIKTVKWTPSWGEERISNMIATRPDWCISRQRVWGVPIIVFYCDGCQEPLTDRKILDRVVATVFAKQYCGRLVFAIGGGTGRAGCQVRQVRREFRKETDILDVWFDSGVSHLAVLTPKNSLPWPAGHVPRRAATNIAAGSTARCWWAWR